MNTLIFSIALPKLTKQELTKIISLVDIVVINLNTEDCYPEIKVSCNDISVMIKFVNLLFPNTKGEDIKTIMSYVNF